MVDKGLEIMETLRRLPKDMREITELSLKIAIIQGDPVFVGEIAGPEIACICVDPFG
jgi:hypothetical protein